MKLSDLKSRDFQGKVIAAYVGRALSLDLPQLYRNIRYGMRADPIVGRMELAELDWDEVEEERLNHMPISEIVDEAVNEAVTASTRDPFGLISGRTGEYLREKLGEDGPRYIEALRAMEEPEPFKFDFGDDIYCLTGLNLCDVPFDNYLNIGRPSDRFGGFCREQYRRWPISIVGISALPSDFGGETGGPGGR